MERMEVDQCAGAAAGALRRSISAPMITSVSERMAECSPVSWLRQRRVSVNCSCPSQEDKMEASLQGTATHRLRCRRLACSAHFEATRPHTSSLLSRVSSQLPAPPGSQCHQNPPEWFRSPESGVTPNSSPSPTRRFRPVGGANIRCPALTPLKRKVPQLQTPPPEELVLCLRPLSHHSPPTRHINPTPTQVLPLLAPMVRRDDVTSGARPEKWAEPAWKCLGLGPFNVGQLNSHGEFPIWNISTIPELNVPMEI
ncbi:uncharacterized protein LOC133467236 isoform X3 [Phyllopteryx taeniolatus]|uniref:uncharacterized protein LOC133467236 isoform X3 n=1 Tax=Phyllopteryx taeniolatus TaxID=161469 RepID=UPI002AD2C1E9|nr:uncharacterized protein LOC133467236 isoform X3 [Phyllopteryx taeniolatus]